MEGQFMNLFDDDEPFDEYFEEDSDFEEYPLEYDDDQQEDYDSSLDDDSIDEYDEEYLREEGFIIEEEDDPGLKESENVLDIFDYDEE